MSKKKKIEELVLTSEKGYLKSWGPDNKSPEWTDSINEALIFDADNIDDNESDKLWLKQQGYESPAYEHRKANYEAALFLHLPDSPIEYLEEYEIKKPVEKLTKAEVKKLGKAFCFVDVLYSDDPNEFFDNLIRYAQVTKRRSFEEYQKIIDYVIDVYNSERYFEILEEEYNKKNNIKEDEKD